MILSGPRIIKALCRIHVSEAENSGRLELGHKCKILKIKCESKRVSPYGERVVRLTNRGSVSGGATKRFSPGKALLVGAEAKKTLPSIARGLSRTGRKKMTEPCYKKQESDPPVCGVHHAVLLHKMVSIDANHADLGKIPCLICPTSQAVVRETRKM